MRKTAENWRKTREIAEKRMNLMDFGGFAGAGIGGAVGINGDHAKPRRREKLRENERKTMENGRKRQKTTENGTFAGRPGRKGYQLPASLLSLWCRTTIAQVSRSQ